MSIASPATTQNATALPSSTPEIASVLVVTQVALAFISRAAPSMQIFSIGFTITLIAGGMTIFVALPDEKLCVGDVVELIPGYAPGTVNWYDAFHVVEGDRVVDIWAVIPRGPGHGGLIA